MTTSYKPMHIDIGADENQLTNEEELSLMTNILLNCSEEYYDKLLVESNSSYFDKGIDLRDKICYITKCMCDDESDKKERKTITECEICQNKKTKILKLVTRELTKRWREFGKEYSKKLSYSLVKGFLETDDYSHAEESEENNLDLETFLVRLVIILCREKNISGQEFESLFDLVKWNCVNHEIIVVLYKLEQCRSLVEKSNKFAKKFAGVILSDCKKSVSRIKEKTEMKEVVETKEANKIKTKEANKIKSIGLKYDDIKIGEEYEVKDRLGDWYVALVHTKLKDIGISVSFFGFNSGEDQTFNTNEIEENVATIGTHTNGFKHTGASSSICPCTRCRNQTLKNSHIPAQIS